jgi:hypothetical protein
LDEDAVDFGVSVEGIDFTKKSGQGSRLGKDHGVARDSDLLGASFLSGYIGSGSGVFTDADEDQTWGDTPLG